MQQQLCILCFNAKKGMSNKFIGESEWELFIYLNFFYLINNSLTPDYFFVRIGIRTKKHAAPFLIYEAKLER
jgi:hypothetical protein